MADLPQPESYEQLLSDMLSAYAAKLGINDFNVGSLNTSFFEVVALATARSSGDFFQMLRDFSVDRATGDALKRLAQEYGVTPVSAQPTIGKVNIIDTGFTKISTQIYAGTSPPNIGSISINVGDASNFPAAGSLYIGRGTPNVEGPIPYTVPPVQIGSYWTITLVSPTTKYHNLSESVILSQGGIRNIPTNTIVVSPGIGTSNDIQYATNTTSTILDGETEVDKIQVTALVPGAAGNVPIGAVKAFASPPYPSLTVSNPLAFTTGADSETDNQLRVRIKRTLASQGLGTAQAVKAALIGAMATSPTGQTDTIVSDSLISNTDGSSTVFIDDGTGYEATSTGVGLESIVDSAIGGEQFFQLQTGGSQAPVAKAFLQSSFEAPFNLINGDTLAVNVGGTIYQHVFVSSDFVSPGSVTSYEITASINGDAELGFEATTANGGANVVIRAKAETHDTLFIVTPNTSGRNAAILMGFPANTVETLRLYKNNVPLTKDGNTASVFSQNQSLWSASIISGDTLIVTLDGSTPTDGLPSYTATITDADFLATGLYATVASTNSLTSWAQVLNSKLPGITVTVSEQQLKLTSNLDFNNGASIIIDPASTLVIKDMFSITTGLSATGKNSNFTLDRNTAQFQLTEPLAEGDILSAGSANTEGSIESDTFSASSIVLSSDAHVWFLIDTAGALIPTGVIAGTLITITKPSTNVIRYTSNVVSAFNNVLVGDYVIVWSTEVPSTDRLEGRVHAKTSTTLDILITSTEWAAVTTISPTTFQNGFVVLRSNFAPQKFRVQAGTKSLDQIATELQAQTTDLTFSVFNESNFVVATTTLNESGSVLSVTSDASGELLNFVSNSSGQSVESLYAFYDSQGYMGEMPLFIHAIFSAEGSADPIDSFITTVTSSAVSGRDPNELISLLHPYGTIRDAQPFGEIVQETSITGSTIGIAYPNGNANLNASKNIRRIRTSDRFYVANPLDFGSQDTAVVVLDDNTVNETFDIPLFRQAKTNTSDAANPNNFNAYDVIAGPTTSFASTFGATFDFANFKVLMQAKKVLKQTPSQTAILYRATKWGRSGEKITVGYIYPSTANAPISNSIVVGDTVDIRITLNSGAASVTSITSTTQWDVTITANTPVVGVDQVTYTWNTVGTNPALSLSGGEYVNILPTTGFSTANTGIFRVSTQGGFTPTATTFTVQRPTGVAVAEVNKATTVNNGISFYGPSTTTAAQVTTYVNANLALFISATLVNDGGTSGSGVLTESTFEDSNFSYNSVQLSDGINWIYSNNLSGSPQFVFKVPLTYPFAGPGNAWYAFNNGESVMLIPTTMDQTQRFTSVLAVSGFTTLGSIRMSDRGNNIELSTNTIGSTGAIEIIGGSANQYQFPVLGTAVKISNSHMSVNADWIASAGVHSDQWFRLQATNKQHKFAGFAANTSVAIAGNTPIAFPQEATVTLSGRTLTQRYFGQPRIKVKGETDTFRVERQGDLVCISWNGIGANPSFSASLNFNDGAGGTVNISPVINTNDSQYAIASGVATFEELAIGDYITINGGAFNPNNNGTFIVTGVSEDGLTIQVTNPNAVSQSGAAFVSGDFTATSGVSEGDTVIFTSPFSVSNQGSFRVVRVYNNSFWIENSQAAEEEVTLVHNPVALGFALSTQFNVTIVSGKLHLAWNGVGTIPTLGNATAGDRITLGPGFNPANQGNFMVTKSSTSGNYLEAIVPGAVAESVTAIGPSNLVVHRPQMQFFEYEAIVPGDVFTVTGSILTLANAGAYPVVRVLDRNTAIVQGALSTLSVTNLGSNAASVFLLEGVAYNGYKHVWLASSNPSSATQNTIVLDTNAQYEKINQSAEVEFTSLSKLNYNTALIFGLDSYRFNTGLIAEANRIVYGDPRDNTTYPGVGAAGADIFIREPLALRITMSIDIRLLTGAPFDAISQQARSAVQYLISSNPVGESIDISSIVSAVRAIPGIISVAIGSPLYNAANDLIEVQPSQKTIIVNPSTDITILQIGS